VKKEVNQIKKKIELLKNYYDSEERKIVTLNRIQAFKISGEYIRNMRVNTITELYRKGFY
jgi:hypothetical protein